LKIKLVRVDIARFIRIIGTVTDQAHCSISLLVFWEETASGIEEWDDIVGGDRFGTQGSVIVDIDPLDEQSNLALIV